MGRFLSVVCMAATLFAVVLILPARAENPVQVSVSIVPQKYFVEKIGGDLVKVSVMVEPGANPHVYEPKPQQMVDLAKSKVYFTIGDPFEQVWLNKLVSNNPNMRVVQTDAGIEKLPMEAHHHHEEEHEKGKDRKREEAEHHHGELDPHIWLSPPLVMLQARNIMNGLIDADPQNKTAYQAGYKKFIDEVVDLDMEIKSIFLSGNQREFMVFHPAWGYFAQAYGLKQVPVEVEGKEPKAADLKHLIDHAKEHGIKVIFVQPQISISSAKVLVGAIDGQLVDADPLATDWAGNLRQVGEKFKAALK